MFLEILTGAGLKVEPHFEHYREGTEDAHWLAECGHRGWVVLTHDRRIRSDVYKIEKLMSSATQVFLLIGHPHDRTFVESAARGLVNNLPRIAALLDKRKGEGFLAKVYRPKGSEEFGEIKLWLTLEKWLKTKRRRR